MTQYIRKQLSQSALARWIVLGIVSFTMMTGYIVAKEMSPLQYLLELSTLQGGLGWSSGEFGLFAGARGFFNVFFLMLFIGGLILDKTNVRFAGTLSCLLMLAGAAAIYYAVAHMDPRPTLALTPSMPSIKRQVLAAALGFAVFGVGYEMCGITVSKVIVKWFSGKEMALAMGIQVALARLGTALALGFSPTIAIHYNISTPILWGVLAVGMGTIVYLVYCMMDVRIDREKHDTTLAKEQETPFRFADLVQTMRNSGFWLITLLCLLYYSALYPFLDFATKLMISKYGVDPEVAGLIPAILPFGSIILTPVFGYLVDSKGRGATIMVVGTIMLTAVLAVFALPLTSSMLAIVLMLVLGVAFSLLPSALWPAVPKIVPMKQLGSAYSIIYYIQNIGLMLIPVWIGHVLEANVSSNGTTDYTQAMWIFTIIGALAIVVAILVLVQDRRKHFGLEAPNIKAD